MFRDHESWMREPIERAVARPDPTAGFGACAKNGCPCQAFEGGASANNCTNCGHQYGDHW